MRPPQASKGFEIIHRNVLDSDKLPSLPVVASKVLEMIQDPDISIPKLCRVFADDAALSARAARAIQGFCQRRR
jgi:HD-like signal output (HDOD) protein